MMKKGVKILLIAAAILVGLLVILSAVGYCAAHKKSAVAAYTSSDGRHTVTVYMVGSPVFPYGPTHCMAKLQQDNKKLCTYSFDICNDGVGVTADNFALTWGQDGVTLRASGDEQEDAYYFLGFDGSAEEIK